MLGWWLPENLSTYGASMLHLVYWVSGIALLIAQLVLVRTHRGQSRAWHEAVWAVVPALVLVWLGLLSHRTPHVTVASGPQAALEHAKGSAQ